MVFEDDSFVELEVVLAMRMRSQLYHPYLEYGMRSVLLFYFEERCNIENIAKRDGIFYNWMRGTYKVIQQICNYNAYLGFSNYLKAIEYSAQVEHPDRFELTSATVKTEQSNRRNWTVWPQRLYIDGFKVEWYHKYAFTGAQDSATCNAEERHERCMRV